MQAPRLIHVAVSVAMAVGLLASSAYGQPPAAELEALHAKLSATSPMVSASEANRALEQLESWQAAADGLPAAQRAMLLRSVVLAALASGDATRAREALPALEKEFGDAGETAQTAYFVAVAAGDAQRALEILPSLADGADREERRLLSSRRRWMANVGRSAPDLTLPTDRGDVAARRRGDKVLLIDFWSMLPPPDAEHAAALAALRKEYDGGNVEIVGVNADAEGRIEQARAFAVENGYDWPQLFPAEREDAPDDVAAFEAGRAPWTVLIDTFGYVRSVGAASDPALQFALRAAVAEARGHAPPVTPRDRDGHEPEMPGAAAAASGGNDDSSWGGPLPSNAEAASKLRQAIAFLKAGRRTDATRMFREIIRDYPGTEEAKVAKEYLGEEP